MEKNKSDLIAEMLLDKSSKEARTIQEIRLMWALYSEAKALYDDDESLLVNYLQDHEIKPELIIWICMFIARDVPRMFKDAGLSEKDLSPDDKVMGYIDLNQLLFGKVQDREEMEQEEKEADLKC